MSRREKVRPFSEDGSAQIKAGNIWRRNTLCAAILLQIVPGLITGGISQKDPVRYAAINGSLIATNVNVAATVVYFKVACGLNGSFFVCIVVIYTIAFYKLRQLRTSHIAPQEVASSSY
ncbi:hypothetical protein AAVH_19862 [Aphelenchoides avenae]|nr:hypothetical protein AAVH_19862 [Aphelenchus avenae]